MSPSSAPGPPAAPPPTTWRAPAPASCSWTERSSPATSPAAAAPPPRPAPPPPRLDAYLVGQAAAAGAAFEDGRLVRELELSETGGRLAVDGDSVEATIVVGADGANGVVARAAGLGPVRG